MWYEYVSWKNNSEVNVMVIEKKHFVIKGMHCASCVTLVERSLRQVAGITEASVNLANTKATITYDPAVVTDAHITDAVAGSGYQALLGAEASEENEKETMRKELFELKRKVSVSLFLGAVILWGSFPGLMETAPALLQNTLVQLLLAIPVQFWAGLGFYRATWPALRRRSANMDTLVAIGTTVAFGYSAFVTFFPDVVASVGMEPLPYFDVSTVIIGLILLGRYFEAKTKT